MKPTFVRHWQEISPYLDEVLDLEGAAREQWLAVLEGTRPEIAHHLRTYLEQLDALATADFLGMAAPPMPLASLAGQRFGSYTLDLALGHGGTGSVWLAHRSDGRFKAQAAVKLLSPALVGHPSERRFAREGNVLARLQHPNISRLLDAGVAADNQPYLVLEYVPGEHIDRYCERHALSVHQRIRLFLDVLGAVAHAHSSLIVHRDIKPSNILVTEDGVAKLLDFGVAALLSPSAEMVTHLTHHAAVGLTPGYAAPEQLRGEGVTTATDVYALGLVLLLLLAGQHPFSPEKKTPAQLVQATLEGEIPRASDMATEPKLARLLRGDLDNIISVAVRRNPAERYATVDQFAQDLRRYLALEPVSARKRSWRYQAAMFVRRHRLGVTLGTAVVCVLLGAILATTSQMLEAQRQRAVAEQQRIKTRQQRDQARLEMRRADAANVFLEALLMADLDPQRSQQSFYERLERGVQLLEQQYRDDPQFVGRMLLQLGVNYLEHSETRRASELYQRAYEIGRASGDTELMVSAQCFRADAEASANIRAGVSERVQEAQRLLAGLPEPNAVLQALCLRAQSRIQSGAGDSRAAEALLLHAKSILEEDGSTYRQLYSAVLEDLAEIYYDRNEPREALRIAQLAGDVEDRNGRGGTFDRLVRRTNAATVLGGLGEYRAALAEYRIISERLKRIEGPQRPHEFTVYYARLLLMMAHPEEALRELDGTLESLRRSENRGLLVEAWSTRGWALTQLRRWAEAAEAFNEGAALALKGYGDQRVDTMLEYLTSQLNLQSGHLASARRHVDRSLSLAGYHTQNAARPLAKALLVASRVALAEGNAVAAEQYARDSLGMLEPIARGPDTSADLGEALLRLAQARIASGARADARAKLERAISCLTNGLGPEHPLTVEARNVLARLAD